MKHSINGVPNRMYSQGIEPWDVWVKVSRHFSKHAKSNMDPIKFYKDSKFGFFIDLRSMRDRSR